jgi:DNA modification methylase
MGNAVSKYDQFLSGKKMQDVASGFDWDNLPEGLFDFQRAITKWALKRGKAAIFADTGLGKSMMQSAWAEAVHQYTGNRVLIVAPLCVAQQTVSEAEKIGVRIKYVREFDPETGIYITNYEMLDAFKEKIEAGYFDGIVLDESSILKHQTSKTRIKIIELAKHIPYRLSCTATPSPNDFMELGSQSEFLGVMDTNEMLAMFFVHDSGETAKWRLKGHGKSKFWEWLATWSVFIKKPSDLGFDDKAYALPKLDIVHEKLGEEIPGLMGGGLSERHKIKRDTVEVRVARAVEIASRTKGPFIIWCHRNDESSALAEALPDFVEVSGSDSIEEKEEKIMAFTTGKARGMITKPKIAGFGMNWQHCSEMAFVGLSDSYEQIYQSIRRCWRFGQTSPVIVHMVAHAAEGPVLANIQRKEAQAEEMATQLVGYMRDFQKKEVLQTVREKADYIPNIKKGKGWEIFNGDCVDFVSSLATDSVDYSVFSPPFASLYTYSNSDRDMGNSKTYAQFWEHFGFLVKELNRVLVPGRNISVHCMNLPTSKTRDGIIGIRDFRGDIIRMFQDAGFIYHSEVCIWKDPVVAMQRTKALGLLWKQIQKDSSMSRQGIPDYVVTFRKRGVNPKPIAHTKEEFPVDRWQHYASPVWFDIKQSNTLNGRHATEDEDERHIAPLQLDLIQRCLELWSAKDDLVLSPFAGIGSEGFVSLQLGRRFIGSELKKSYFDFACKNLEIANSQQVKEFLLQGNPRELAVNFHRRNEEPKAPTPDEAQTSLFEELETSGSIL